MHPKGSFLCSQEHATGLCPKVMIPVHTLPSYFFKISEDPEDGGSMHLWNIGVLPRHYAVSHLRRPQLLLQLCFWTKWCLNYRDNLTVFSINKSLLISFPGTYTKKQFSYSLLQQLCKHCMLLSSISVVVSWRYAFCILILNLTVPQYSRFTDIFASTMTLHCHHVETFKATAFHYSSCLSVHLLLLWKLLLMGAILFQSQTDVINVCLLAVKTSLMHCHTVVRFNITACSILTFILKKFWNKNN